MRACKEIPEDDDVWCGTRSSQGHEQGEGLKIGRVNQKPSLQQFFKI